MVIAPAGRSPGRNPPEGERRSAAEAATLVLLPVALTVWSLTRALNVVMCDVQARRLEVLSQLALLLLLTAWFRAYSRRHRIVWPVDMGLFLLLAWWAVLPCYVVQRQGWRGLGVVGAFAGLWLLALLGGGVLGWGLTRP